jgi:hypothetical protein
MKENHVQLRKRSEATTRLANTSDALHDSRTQGRWDHQEHEKFILGNHITNSSLSAEHVQARLEEGRDIHWHKVRGTNPESRSKVLH